MNYLPKWNVSITFFISLWCIIWRFWDTIEGSRWKKKIINFHSVQFLIMSNILCFHMPDDGPAEDGPEKKWNLLKQKWLFEKLAHFIGKYVSACNSDNNSLLTELLKCQSLYRNVLFIWPDRDNWKDVFVLGVWGHTGMRSQLEINSSWVNWTCFCWAGFWYEQRKEESAHFFKLYHFKLY